MPFTRTWDAAYEAQPADNEDINLGATRIRNLKVDIQQREAVDHSWAGTADDGKHVHVTLLAQSGAPVLGGTDAAIYGMQVAGNTELFWKDSHGNILQVTSAGGLVVGTVNGDLTVTGNLTTDGNITAVGSLNGASLTVAASTTINTSGIFNIANDAQFYMDHDGSGDPIINFNANTYLIFNRGTGKFSFVVGGLVVFTVP